MNQSEATTTRLPETPVSIYDRFTGLYDLMFRVNRYRSSIERYLRENPLPLSHDARILDAGCGTGLLTLAMLRVAERPVHINAVDLSLASLVTARRAVERTVRGEEHENGPAHHRVYFTQANVLELPFPDRAFELVLTSGVLEYVPLREGMAELSRVLVPGGYLIYLPVVPSPMSRVLELMFSFKTHPPREVAEHTRRFFRVVEEHRFTPLEPIGWTKTLVLAQKP